MTTLNTSSNVDIAGITLTKRAQEEVLSFIQAESMPSDKAGLRIAILPGGCSGFKYNLTVEDNASEDDIIVRQENGIQIFIDPFSLPYLQGTTIDYESTIQQSGFSFKNPNSKGGCGCGSSFGV